MKIKTALVTLLTTVAALSFQVTASAQNKTQSSKSSKGADTAEMTDEDVFAILEGTFEFDSKHSPWLAEVLGERAAGSGLFDIHGDDPIHFNPSGEPLSWQVIVMLTYHNFGKDAEGIKDADFNSIWNVINPIPVKNFNFNGFNSNVYEITSGQHAGKFLVTVTDPTNQLVYIGVFENQADAEQAAELLLIQAAIQFQSIQGAAEKYDIEKPLEGI
ncbi:MAG: hypothetical protein P1U89_24025 [Verrucomicrobiales bacterium]|nr:hypothetical protein [Verrucomicrobiales bacterium]